MGASGGVLFLRTTVPLLLRRRAVVQYCVVVTATPVAAQTFGHVAMPLLTTRSEVHLAAIFDRYASRQPDVPFARVRCWHEQLDSVPETLEEVIGGPRFSDDDDATGRAGGKQAARSGSSAGSSNSNPLAALHWSRRRGRTPRVMSHASFMQCVVSCGFIPPHMVGNIATDALLTSAFLSVFPPTSEQPTPESVTTAARPSTAARVTVYDTAVAGDGTHDWRAGQDGVHAPPPARVSSWL